MWSVPVGLGAKRTRLGDADSRPATTRPVWRFAPATPAQPLSGFAVESIFGVERIATSTTTIARTAGSLAAPCTKKFELGTIAAPAGGASPGSVAVEGGGSAPHPGRGIGF